MEGQKRKDEVKAALQAVMLQRRARWQTAALHAWISIFSLALIYVNITRTIIEGLPSFLPQIVYFIGYAVAVVFALSAGIITVEQLRGPKKFKLTEAEAKLLGLDPSLVSFIKVEPTPQPNVPTPSSPLAWATTSTVQTPTSPVSPARTNLPSNYVSPYRGTTGASPVGTGNESPYFSPSGRFRGPEETQFRARPAPQSPFRVVSPSKVGALTDEENLNEFLRDQNRRESLKFELAANGTESVMGYGVQQQQQQQPQSPIPLSPYRTMPKPDSSAKKSSTGDDVHNYGAATELYRRLGVINHIDGWAENIRLWLAPAVVQRTLKWMAMVEQHLGRDALYQSQLSQVQMGVNVVQQQQNNLWSVNPITSQSATMQPQQQRYMHEYMKLERYFGEFANSREYVVDRIRVLGKGRCLENYIWNSGAGKDKWTTDLPTDAQIIAHLFCCYMDEQVARTTDLKAGKLPPDAFNVFSAKHFIRQKGAKPKSFVALYQTSVHPPHFNLVISPEADKIEEWVVLKGRNNLFHALALFAFYIMKTYRGYFRQVNLKSPDIGFLDCLEEDNNDYVE